MTPREVLLIQRIVNHEITDLRNRVRDSSWPAVRIYWDAKLQEYLELRKTLNQLGDDHEATECS